MLRIIPSRVGAALGAVLFFSAACSESNGGGNESGGTGATGTGGSGAAGAGGTGTGGTGTGGNGGVGTGGSGATGTGGSGASGSGGTGSGGTGTGGSSGSGGSGGETPIACGTGKSTPTGALLENYDGTTQVLEWRQADKANPGGTVIEPMGSMTIHPTGEESLATGALAMWAMKNRPCMDGSAYSGIEFDVSGTVTSLLFRIQTPATLPVSDGGACTDDTKCGYSHYQLDVTSSLSAGHVRVDFASLTPPFGMPDPFDKSALVGLVFLTLDADMGHGFTIDNVQFYAGGTGGSGGTGTGGSGGAGGGGGMGGSAGAGTGGAGGSAGTGTGGAGGSAGAGGGSGTGGNAGTGTGGTGGGAGTGAGGAGGAAGAGTGGAGGNAGAGGAAGRSGF